MNINKKLGRVKQWAGEKMGAESKTGVSEEFRNLEMEMTLRQDGMERLQRSMTSYLKSLSKRNEGDDKEKIIPTAYLGQTMVNHGEDFEPDSEFGNCLIGMGRTNERIAKIQENYVSHATTGWLESLERSMTQMKEYQNARKKLENRRLAYDASLSKMQKAKKEDYRTEEELRSQKIKYEESSEDVLRRMQDIKEAEVESVQDLGTFLDAELEYYDKCRDELLRLKREWPAGNTTSSNHRDGGRHPRSRSNTAHSYEERYNTYEEPIPEPEPVRPSIRSTARVMSSSRLNTHQEDPDFPVSPRPNYKRSQTFEGPRSINRTTTPINGARKPSLTADPGMLKVQLRPPPNRLQTANLFSDRSDESNFESESPEHSYGERSISPATSHGSDASRSATYTPVSATFTGRKGPPPPPPSRTKKPPPPPPMKRAEISSSSVNRY